MRRSTYLAPAALLLLLGLYGGAWFFVAGRIEDGFGEWARSLQGQDLDLTWRTVRVAGFPLSFRIELGEARLRNGKAPDAGEVRVPRLAGSARPWNFRRWQIAAPEGVVAAAGPAGAPDAVLKVASATGLAAVGDDGGATAWLALEAPALDTGIRLAAREALLWLSLPPHPPRNDSEPALGTALDFRGLNLPAAPAALRNALDELAVGVTLRGPVPAKPPREAAAAWRDAGGTLELDRFALSGSTLALTGSGTMALDRDLQPIGSFSVAITGYDKLTTALVAGGLLGPGEAALTGFLLRQLARAGPDGRPQIATSFTLQDGEMFLGALKLGKAPRLRWP